MTADPAAAAEITQDVFVWLIHHPNAYDPARGDLAAFLAGVARKLLLRRQAVERRWMPLDEAALLPQQDPPPEPDTAALRRAIASLPARYREAVVLCDLEGKTYEEAAGLLGCATGTVRSRLHRARDLLARKLTWKKQDQGCRI
jgi:RNA polymerase sigma-70 factor (ECF subfamily)